MKRLLTILLLPLLGFLLAFFVMEVILRVHFLIKAPPFRPSETGIELNPNGSGFEKGAYVKINSQGLRDYEYPLQKAPNTFRIIVLGDSVTFGTGVTMEETYAKRLEKILNAGSSRRRYEVLNFGIPGAETHHELLYFEKKGLGYSPDLLILGYFLNDLSPPFEAIFTGGDTTWTPQAIGFVKNQLKRLFVVRLILEKFDLALNLHRLVLTRDERIATSYWEHIIGMYSVGTYWMQNQVRLRQLVRMAREKNIRFLLVILPFENQLFTTSLVELIPQSLIKEFGQQEQFPVLDLIPSLKHASGRLYLDGDNIHLNTRGHQVIAEAIYEVLRSQVLIPDAVR